MTFDTDFQSDCWRCHEEARESAQADGRMLFARMILCPSCGNKRCPKASDHTFPCTGSNELGQPGSVYA